MILYINNKSKNMASKTESKVMGYSAAGVSLAALVGYLYFKGDKISDLSDDQLSKILDGIGAEITDAGSEMIKGNGSVVSSYSISTDPKDGGSESKPLLSIPNEKTPAQPYKYVINKGGDTEPQFQVVKDAEGNIIGYYKAPTSVGANDGEYFKVNTNDPEQAGTWYREVSVNPTTGKITGKEVTSTGGLAEESTDLGSATVGTTNITSVAGVSGNVTVESLVSQETFRELKDSNGNVIGLFKEGTVGANDSRLYINGKWYNDLKINQDGTITDKAGKELGEIGSSEYELKINDVTYKGNVGAGVKYDAITTQGDFTKNPPVLPEVVTVSHCSDKLTGVNSIPVGVEKDSLDIRTLDLTKNTVNIITGMELNDIKVFGRFFVKEISSIIGKNCYVFDLEKEFKDIEALVTYYDTNILDNFKKFGKFVFDVYNKYKEAGFDTSVLSEYGEYVCVIVGIDKFKNMLGSEFDGAYSGLLSMIKGMPKIHFVIIDSADNFKKREFDSWYKDTISGTKGIWLGNGMGSQYTLKSTLTSRVLSTKLEKNFGYYVDGNTTVLVKFISEQGEEDTYETL